MSAASDNSTILSSNLSVSSSTVEESIAESWKLNGPYDSFRDFM